MAWTRGIGVPETRRVASAIEVARRYAAAHYPDALAVYLTGSVAHMDPEAELPRCSDVDVKVVLDVAELPPADGKVVVHDVIVDVSYVLPALHDRVTALHFAAGPHAHMVLVAALRNPTVRRRYANAQTVLAANNGLGIHEQMLSAMGAGAVDSAIACKHLEALADWFDLAVSVRETPYRFAADMQPGARVIAIDGAREIT